MNIRKYVIYFVSDTGNSYRAAMWLYQFCIVRGMAVSVVPVENAWPAHEIAASPETLVCAAFPTHGFFLPGK